MQGKKLLLSHGRTSLCDGTGQSPVTHLSGSPWAVTAEDRPLKASLLLAACYSSGFCQLMLSGEAALFHFPAVPLASARSRLITKNCHWPGQMPLILFSSAPPHSASQGDHLQNFGLGNSMLGCSAQQEARFLFKSLIAWVAWLSPSVLIDFTKATEISIFAHFRYPHAHSPQDHQHSSPIKGPTLLTTKQQTFIYIFTEFM